VSTHPAKRIRQRPATLRRPGSRTRFAPLFGSRKGTVLSLTQRIPRVLLPSGTLAVFLALYFLEGGLLCSAQVGSTKYHTGQSPDTAVKAAYLAYLRAWKDKDYTALNQLLSDDYQAVNFQGIVSTKANELATAKEDRTYTLKGDVMSVVVFGDTAVSSGLIESRWKDEHGSPQGSTFRFLAILRKQQSDWKLVATQSTKFGQPATPAKN
jgi:ketosteroid isomerase-like protein